DAEPVVPRFAEVTRSAGVRHVYDGEWEYFVGGGVAAFDCSGDGLPELWLAGGERPASLWGNGSAPGGPIRFSRLDAPAAEVRAATGAYPLEIDGDGILDLVILRLGEDLLLRGLGGCRFARANADWGLGADDLWTTAFSATWRPGEMLPVLAFGSYVDRTDPSRRIGACAPHRLVRPDPTGARYGEPLLLAPGFCALSMLFSDWSRTGRRDLRVSNDRHYAPGGQEQLFRFAPGEPVIPWSAADGWRPVVIWGMGIASADVTGDGRPDYFLTSQGDNRLQVLAPDADGPVYDDIAFATGATATQPAFGGDALPSTAWHAEFADMNNDTWPDLFIAKGNVEAQEGYALRDPSEILVGRPDGTFLRPGRATGLASFDRARGAVVTDLDADGLLDLVVVHRRRPVRIWRGIGTGTADAPVAPGGWVAVELRQPAPNTGAVGAWIELRTDGRTQVREVTVGGGHASGAAGPIHLGIGASPSAEIRVTWPDGTTGPWLPLTAGSRSVILQGADAPLAWTPPDGAAAGTTGGNG
ncbi:MAG: CRTAC1 family protein, partial [Chloroflexota bacterium]